MKHWLRKELSSLKCISICEAFDLYFNHLAAQYKLHHHPPLQWLPCLLLYRCTHPPCLCLGMSRHLTSSHKATLGNIRQHSSGSSKIDWPEATVVPTLQANTGTKVALQTALKCPVESLTGWGQLSQRCTANKCLLPDLQRCNWLQAKADIKSGTRQHSSVTALKKLIVISISEVIISPHK